jgi:protein phosphatase 1G
MHCLAPNTSGDGTGCDNMTAIIVKFNFNSTPLSVNNKRPLSPEHTSPTEISDNSNTKKLKILTENGTKSPLNSSEQTSS